MGKVVKLIFSSSLGEYSHDLSPGTLISLAMRKWHGAVEYRETARHSQFRPPSDPHLLVEPFFLLFHLEELAKQIILYINNCWYISH